MYKINLPPLHYKNIYSSVFTEGRPLAVSGSPSYRHVLLYIDTDADCHDPRYDTVRSGWAIEFFTALKPWNNTSLANCGGVAVVTLCTLREPNAVQH